MRFLLIYLIILITLGYDVNKISTKQERFWNKLYELSLKKET